MNKKFLMTGIKKDGTYKTPGGVPFMTNSTRKSIIFKAMVPHYRVDEFMMEVYGCTRLIGIIDDVDGRERIRIYRINGGKYIAVHSGSNGFDSDYYYVDDVIDPDGNLLYWGN